ncbi:MAG: hypothetical protein DRP24_03565 [Thermotoga sp.]|nr:MAG: hypothetical protein DRP24_03565 [Thermotoga sp.]
MKRGDPVRIFFEEKISDDVKEFIRKFEHDLEETDIPEKASVKVTKKRRYDEGLNLYLGEERVEILNNGQIVATFSKGIHISGPWAVVRAILFKEKSVINWEWARKLVSGLFQALIVMLESEDKEGFSHSQRVAKLSEELGERLGLSDEEISSLREHAMLHDVGKIGIEQLMLYTPTRIRLFENLPQDHTILGSVYLASIELLWDVVPSVRSHHERWDGKGYPDGLKGEEIPYFARIIAVCDFYDELTHFVTSEWDGGPKTPEEALNIIEKEAGKALDPRIAKVFVDMMREKIKRGDL